MDYSEKKARMKSGVINCAIPLTREECRGNCYRVTVDGMKGGHYKEILGTGHINAAVVLSRVLYKFQTRWFMRIVSVDGGTGAEDTIASASAVVMFEGEKTPAELAQYMFDLFKEECNPAGVEPHMDVRVEAWERTMLPMDETSTLRVLGFLVVAPNGEQVISSDENHQELIYANVGKLETKEEEFCAEYGVSGTVPSQKRLAGARIRLMCRVCGGSGSRVWEA